jgi:hypothetical protein
VARSRSQTGSTGRDHPALQDFVAAMRPYADAAADYDAFTRQWFEDRVVPQYVVSGADKRADGDGYVVTVTLQNIGTGTMPVEVAATAGERWQKPPDTGGIYIERDDYRDARETVTIGGGESREVTIRCDFDPEQVVVDPDVRVLQLKRKQAVIRL